MLLRYIFYISLSLCISFTINAQENGDILETYTNRTGRKVEKIHWDETQEKHILISYPKDFNPEKTYHINFWFPGTGGKPGQGIEDENAQYIGIGLSYLERSRVPKRGYCTSHWDLCRNIEKSMVDRLGLSIGIRILSGVSKGGWLAFHTTLIPPKELHGIAIIAAGKYHQVDFPPNLHNRKLAVFVGTGETDSNYPYAQIAIPYYKKATVESLCYEEWPREGHVSIISPRVNEWLDVQAQRHNSPEELTDYCEAIILKKLKQIEEIDDKKDSYIKLRHLIGNPATVYISKSTKDKIIQKGRELIKSDTLKLWLVDFKKHRDLVKEEAELFNTGNLITPDLGKLAKKYQNLAATTTHKDISGRAANAYLRVTKVHSIYTLQDIARKEAEYLNIEREFNAFKKQLTLANQKPAEADQNHLNALAAQLASLRSKAAMKAFYDIEWYNKYQIDPAMDKLINEDAANVKEIEIYSGIGF